MPKISVVIPTRNEAQYIERTLISLRNQTEDDVEIIVSDYNSTDDTLKIAEKYVDKIVSVDKPGIGIGRREGFNHAKGKFFVSADADILYPKNYLESITKPLLDPHVVASTGLMVPLDGDLLDNLFTSLFLSPFTRLANKFKLFYAGGGAMAFKKDAYFCVDGFKHHPTGEDILLLKELSSLGKVVHIPSAKVFVSMRRVKKWGKLNYFFFHSLNFFKIHLTKKSFSNYSPITDE